MINITFEVDFSADRVDVDHHDFHGRTNREAVNEIAGGMPCNIPKGTAGTLLDEFEAIFVHMRPEIPQTHPSISAKRAKMSANGI